MNCPQTLCLDDRHLDAIVLCYSVDIRGVNGTSRNFTVPKEGKKLVCAFNNEKALLGTFSGQCVSRSPHDSSTSRPSLQTLLLGDNLLAAPRLAALLRTLPRLQDHDLGPELDTRQHQHQQLHCDLLYSDPQVLLI